MTKYLLLSSLFFLLLFRPTLASADARINWNFEGQIFSNESKTAEARVNLKDKELAILSNKKRRKLKLDLKLLQNGDFYISEDGKWIVWILKSFSAWTLEENTPVAIVFANDKEIKRVNYREAGSFKLEYTTSHTNWLESVKVDFKASEITLKEHGLFGKKTKINWDANEINTTVPPPEVSVEPPSGPMGNGYKVSDLVEDPVEQQKKILAASQEYMEKMKVYSAEMLKITEWYAAETKILASMVDDMSDADVNAASQKLLADYNRKLIKLQAQMPQWNPN